MTSEMVTAFSSGISLIKTDILALLVIVIPLALVIMGIMSGL